MIGANINAYFKAAMAYPVERLESVLRGQDNSIPSAAAMMALQIKKPMVDAMRGQEAAQKPKEPSVREQMTRDISMLPENTGIMNLPVEAQYAEGGIVAFDDGGYVPGYAAAGAVDAKLAELQAEAAKYAAMIAADPDSPSAKAYLAHLNEMIQAKQAKLGQVKPAGVAAIADKKVKNVADTSFVPYGEVTPQNKLQQGFNFTVPPEQSVVPAAPPIIDPSKNPMLTDAQKAEAARRQAALDAENAYLAKNPVAVKKRAGEKTSAYVKNLQDQLAEVNKRMAARGQNTNTLSYRTLAEKKKELETEIAEGQAKTVAATGELPAADRLAAENKVGKEMGAGYLAATQKPAAPSAATGAVDQFKDVRVSGGQQQAGYSPVDPRAAYSQQGVGSLQQRAGIGDLAKSYKDVSGMGPDIESKYAAAEAAGVKSLEEANVAREAARPKEKAMEGMEKYMAAEEKATKGKEARNLNSALVAAGLAIAGGQSQYALQNIAQGAQVGVKQYNAGIDKLEEAAKERAKMMLQIEEARRAEARGDWKDAYDRKDKVNELQQSYKLKGIDALAKITGEDKKAAADIFTSFNKIASDERIAANAQAGATSRAISGDINALERAKLGGAGRTDIENVIRDNARQRTKDWIDSAAGKRALIADPNAADAVFNKYLAEERAARQNQALLNPDTSLWGKPSVQ